MKRIIIAAAAALLALSAGAQDISKAKELYQAGMYSQAMSALEGIPGEMAQGYRTLCALSMGSDGAYAMAGRFVNAYPECILTPQVRFLWGVDLFDAERYEEALTQLNSITAKDIFTSRIPEYTYKLGYSAYGVGEWERAKSILKRMRSIPESDYTAPAYYALGFISYSQGNFREASDWFLLAAKDYRFRDLANYYILECRFNEKDYKYVVQFGEDLFDKVPADRQPHMARIMSESYLVLGNAEKARTYYVENLRSKAARTRADYFYAGEVLYMVEDWQGSVDNFMQMGERRDSIGQIASYQLGYANIKTRNKVAAMQAFKEAADLDYSKEIKEDAYYNYAKLAFDLGGDTAPFQEYLRRYGTGAKGDRIYSYMALAALKNHDYEGAVAAYDNIENLEPRMQYNYMKAYFLRAMELMENGSWRAAVPHLKAAAYYSHRRDGFNQLARYYLAEAYYRDGKYSEARNILKDLYNLSALPKRTEGDLISYQMAYTYFKEGDYENAIKWFDNYISLDKVTMGSDAETRIADSYFFSGNYEIAVLAYERQMANYPNPDNLYPAYRAGLAAGLQGDDSRKIEFLENAKTASPAAPYYGESMLELGRAYMAVQDNEDAERTFRTLRKNTTDPTLDARALLELGTIARANGSTDDALDCYKRVVELRGTYTEDALLAIESIYRTREDPEAYIAYVNSLGSLANRTDAQKEEVYFSSAEQVYLSGQWQKAINTLGTYLEAYPGSSNFAKAHFYIADSYRNLGSNQAAADEYQIALESGLSGAMEETATLNFARTNYALGNYAKAFTSYRRLSEIARMEENVQAAQTGLMRSSYRARQWEDALACSDAVLRKSGLPEDLSREARYIRAKSLLSTSRRSEALPLLQELSQKPSTAEGAEASYLIIQDQYDRAEFDGIQEMVYAFASGAGDQNYWLAKAFIVLGDTFAEQGNLAQARATFDSIRSGYEPSGAADDVLDQVEQRMRRL